LSAPDLAKNRNEESVSVIYKGLLQRDLQFGRGTDPKEPADSLLKRQALPGSLLLKMAVAGRGQVQVNSLPLIAFCRGGVGQSVYN
jgi:hypothetical protein